MGHEVVIPFILTSLAVYRVSHMLTNPAEGGPFDVLTKWRRLLVRWEQKRGKGHWIIDGFMCILCVSFWIGFLGAAFLPYSSPAEYVILSLALSAVTVLLKKHFG